MTNKTTTSTAARRLLPTTSCSPSSFAETFEDLHVVRGKQVWTMAYCHGDAMIDNLRIARARLERSLKTLRKCTATGRENEERHDIGRYLEGVVDDLEDGGTNRMEWGWFLRRAGTVMDTVLDAEGMDDDEWPAPEEETWKDFRALSAALREHGEAIKQLHAAESLAAPSPVNVKSPPTGEKEA